MSKFIILFFLILPLTTAEAQFPGTMGIAWSGCDGPYISIRGNYDFGNADVSVGLNERTFTLFNCGSQNATGLNGVFTGTQFSFKGGAYPGTGGTCAGTLTRSQKCTVVAEFDPDSTIQFNGILQINFNVGGVESVSRDLSGTGI